MRSKSITVAAGAALRPNGIRIKHSGFIRRLVVSSFDDTAGFARGWIGVMPYPTSFQTTCSPASVTPESEVGGT
jgi:hypothetical protein